MRRIRTTQHRISRTLVPGVRVHKLAWIHDRRGDLCAGEFLRDIPFIPKRFFLIFDVPNHKQRGAHAHKACHQFLLCLCGQATVGVTDGTVSQTFRLERLKNGIHIPPGIWCTQSNYSHGAILLVIASHYYDPADYIRDYQVYCRQYGK